MSDLIDRLIGNISKESDSTAVVTSTTAVEFGANVLVALQELFYGRCFVSVTAFDHILLEHHRFGGDVVAVDYSMESGALRTAYWDGSSGQLTEPASPEVGDIAIVQIAILQMYWAMHTESDYAALGRIAGMSDKLIAKDGVEPALTADLRYVTEKVSCWLSNRERALEVVMSSGTLTMEDLSALGKQADSALTQHAFNGFLPALMPEEKAPAQLFVQQGKAPAPRSRHASGKEMVRVEDLKASLGLDTHALSEAEKGMIVRPGDNYVPDERIIKIAQIIKEDWHLPLVDLAPNIILEGESGSGKTAATKFLSYVWGLPRTKMTMSPTFESANLIGAFYPFFSDITEWGLSPADEKALCDIQTMLEESALSDESIPKGTGLVLSLKRALAREETRERIRVCYDLPSPEEVSINPENAWRRLGTSGVCPDTESVRLEADRVFEQTMYRLITILTEKVQDGAVSYRFIESELMRAFRYGWLVEIQEASSVLRPGVLTELNSLMEPGGSIELPNGERIFRHPDTVVIITTNHDYAGNVDLNESLRDRCVLGEKMDLPPAEVMAERAMAQTGFQNREEAIEAANTICAVNALARERNVRGAFGMRSLIGWVLDLKRGDYSPEAFKRRVIYKMTTCDEDVEVLMDAYESTCGFARERAVIRRRSSEIHA